MKNAGLGRVSSEIRKGLEQRGYEIKPISTRGTSLPSYFAYTLLELPFRLPRNCDIYHILTPMEGIYTPKAKSIVTFYDLIPLCYPEMCGAGLGGSGWKNRVGRIYFRWASGISARARKVVCISEDTKRDVIKVLGVDEKKMKVIRLGIREDLDYKPRKENERLKIGYLGQLDRRKRVGLLIKEFRKSSLAGELLIGGTGVDEKALRDLARGDNRIRFGGLIPDSELVDFYNCMDILVFPTWVEGYGLPPVEAMACKKPVIVLGDSIMPWEIKRRCIIVPNLDLVFNNEKYLRGLMASVDIEGNYQWAKKEHSWDKCVDEYIKVYKEVIDGR